MVELAFPAGMDLKAELTAKGIVTVSVAGEELQVQERITRGGLTRVVIRVKLKAQQTDTDRGGQQTP